MSTDPTQMVPPSLTDALLPLVTPVAQQAVATATADLQQRLTSVEQQLAAGVTAAAPVIVGDLTQAAGAVLTTVEHDVTTQRVLVWGVVGAVLIAALAIIAFALLGNATANRWVGAAPAAVIGIVLWVSNAGAVLPKRATSPAA